MPFVLIIIGTVLLVSSVRNTYGQTNPAGGPGLGALIQDDFTGPSNFIYWVVSLLIIGAVGYIPKLRPISVAFLTLVIIILFLTKGNPNSAGGGFFSQFTQQIGTTQQATIPATSPSSSSSSLIPNLGSLIPKLPTIPGF